MKRLIKVFSVILALSMLLCVSVSAEEADTVPSLVDGTFETVDEETGLPEDWVSWCGDGQIVDFSVDTQEFHSGAQSLKLQTDMSGTACFYYQLDNSYAGKVLMMTAWVKVMDGTNTGSVHLAMQSFDDGNNNVGEFMVPVSAKTGVWTQLKLKITVPAKAKRTHLQLRLWGAKGGFWFDDFYLCDYEDYPQSSIITQKPPADDDDEDDKPSSNASSRATITPSTSTKPAAPSSDNADNGDGETDNGTLWTVVGIVGGIVVLAGIGAAVYFFVIKKKK